MKPYQLLLFVLLFPATALADYQLLRFRAEWCTPCHQQQAIFKSAGVPALLRRYQVRDVYLDADENPRAMHKYKVVTLPCTILIEVGSQNKATILKRWAGYQSDNPPLLTAPQYREFVNPAADGPRP